MPGTRMTLDHPVLAVRRRTTYTRRSSYERRALGSVSSRVISDVRPSKPAQPPRPISNTSAPQAHRPRLTHSTVLKRETIRRRPKVRHHRSVKAKLTTIMAVALFVFGIGVGLNGLRGNHQVEAQVERLAAQAVAGDNTADVPSEQPTGGTSGYQVAGDLPRTLTIPKIGVEARVLRTTTKPNNELGAPANIFDTAWYDGSAKPGQPGAMLIDGHVSGPTRNGVFYKLKELRSGDKLYIERGDGQHFTYTVVSTQAYEAGNVDMAAAMVPVTAGRPGLNLITCTGQVDDSGSHFTERLLVRASQD